MVGGLRERTASMISLGSMPWRYAEVVPRSVCPSWRWMMLTAKPSRASSTVGVAQLMGREPSAHAGRNGELAQLAARGGGRPTAPAGATVDHAEQRSGRQQHPVRLPRRELFEPNWSMPASRRLSPLP
jgi:hypothetical protein